MTGSPARPPFPNRRRHSSGTDCGSRRNCSYITCTNAALWVPKTSSLTEGNVTTARRSPREPALPLAEHPHGRRSRRRSAVSQLSRDVGTPAPGAPVGGDPAGVGAAGRQRGEAQVAGHRDGGPAAGHAAALFARRRRTELARAVRAPAVRAPIAGERAREPVADRQGGEGGP